MALPTYTGGTDYVRQLDDHVKGGAEVVKYAMDRFGDEFKVWFNETFIPSLLKTDNGNSGADNIGTTPILPGADTVQKALAALLTQIQAAAIGQIPDGTITDAKLSNAEGQIKNRVSTLQTDVGTLQTSVNDIDSVFGTHLAADIIHRKIILSDQDANGEEMENGDIWIKYEAGEE
jgi:hypothetical protein